MLYLYSAPPTDTEAARGLHGLRSEQKQHNGNNTSNNMILMVPVKTFMEIIMATYINGNTNTNTNTKENGSLSSNSRRQSLSQQYPPPLLVGPPTGFMAKTSAYD